MPEDLHSPDKSIKQIEKEQKKLENKQKDNPRRIGILSLKPTPIREPSLILHKSASTRLLSHKAIQKSN